MHISVCKNCIEVNYNNSISIFASGNFTGTIRAALLFRPILQFVLKTWLAKGATDCCCCSGETRLFCCRSYGGRCGGIRSWINKEARTLYLRWCHLYVFEHIRADLCKSRGKRDGKWFTKRSAQMALIFSGELYSVFFYRNSSSLHVILMPNLRRRTA